MIAKVILTESAVELPDRVGFTTTETDSAGVYEFSGLTSGDKVLVVSSQGYSSNRSIVTLGLAHRLRQDFELELAAAVQGRVLNKHNLPVAGAVVRAINTDHSIEAWRSVILESDLPQAITDDLGYFRLSNLAVGEAVVLEVSTKGSLVGFSSAIALDPGDVVEDIVVSIKKGVSISGTVTNDAGEPVVGATVIWTSLGESPVPHSIELVKRKNRRAVTDQDGEFLLSDVATGKMRVGVVHADHFAFTRVQDVSEDDLATGVVYVQIVMTKRP